MTNDPKLNMIILGFAEYLEEMGVKIFNYPDMYKPMTHKFTELNEIKNEVTRLEQDIYSILELAKRSDAEVKNAKNPAAIKKKYYALLIEKTKRIEQRKEEIKSMIDDF